MAELEDKIQPNTDGLEDGAAATARTQLLVSQSLASRPGWFKSRLRQFAGYLTFEGLGSRIGIELSISVLLYSGAILFFPWEAVGVRLEWRGLCAWFSSCALVMIFDHRLFSRPAAIFHLVCQLDCRGAYEPAIKLLDQLSPYGGSEVPCPNWIFHLKRSEILSHLGRPDLSAVELDLARESGAPSLQLALAAITQQRCSGCFDQAAEQLAAARGVHGDLALLALEEALLVFEQHAEPRKARKLFERVLMLPNQLHFSGETTKVIAHGYLDATRLWTGEAEEALAGLSDAIRSVEATASIIESLNPILASLMLERSFYLATHQEPLPAVQDLKKALALCSFPPQRKRALEIKDELEWRYQMKP